MNNRTRNMLGMGLLSFVMLTGCNKPTSTASASASTSTSVAASTAKSTSVSTSTAPAFDKTQSIVPYTRDTTSGTRDGFMGKIGLKACATSDAGLKTSVQQVASNGDMITALSTQEYGIGYFSADSITDAAAKGVKVLNYAGVEPTEANILGGTYGLSRNFNYCVAQETDATKKLIVDAFVAFMGTQEGLTIVKTNGGMAKISTTTPSWTTVKTQFTGIESDHSTVTINFGGSTSVEKIARALSADFKTRAGNFVANHNHTGSGDAYKSTQGAQKGTLDIGFASREFNLTSGEPLAAGTYGKICVDGIVVGVSSKNPMTNITADQAKAVYDKTDTATTKWSALIA
ncbi:MAG: hypothetical protein LKM30_02960 [Bacilli bacterium]|jgi:phosphate transport system substrate-binding protein|nr:hypothetical protein [Bacilli bacterium]